MQLDIRPAVERILRQLVLTGLPVLGAGWLNACSSVADMRGAGGAGMGGAGDMGGAGGMGGIALYDGGLLACQPLGFTCGSPPSCPPYPVPDGGTPGQPTPLPLTTKSVPFDPNDARFAALYQGCVGADASNACSADCVGLCRAVAAAGGGGPLVGGSTYVDCRLTCSGDGSADGASPQGPQMMVTFANAVCGRRAKRCPPTARFRRSRGDSVGAHLARAAELEAESIPAFRRLADALVAHGAPEELVYAARAAMTDEGRHWKQTRDLARHRGGRPIRPRVQVSPFALLEEVAIDNAVEGCVRETYGALVAAHQAEEARDPGVRRLMAGIATDEAAHAALAWRIDAWVCGCVGRDLAVRRSAAAIAAVGELVAGATASGSDPGVRAALGLPAPRESQALRRAAWTQLWAPRLLLA
jgi:hypothetical protein